MADKKRNAPKPTHVERILSTSPSIRSIISYHDIEDKLRSGIYKRNETTRLKNIAYLRKTEKRLTRKIDNGKSIHTKGDRAKIRKIHALLPLLEVSAENGDGGGGGTGNGNTYNKEANADCIEKLARVSSQLEEAHHLLAVSARREIEMRDEIIRSRTAAAESTRALIDLQRRCNSGTLATTLGNNNDPSAPNNKRNTRRTNK